MSHAATGSHSAQTDAIAPPRAADVQDAGTRASAAGEVNPLGPGARLATAREAQGLSLGDVARQLKLSVRQVEALERDDYDAFPSRVFVRGFLRNYGRLLQVDLEHQIAQLGPAEPASAPEPAHVRTASADSGARVRRIRWSLAALLAMAIAVALFRPAPDRGAGPATSLDAPPGTVQLSAPPVSAPAGGMRDPDPLPSPAAAADDAKSASTPLPAATVAAPAPLAGGTPGQETPPPDGTAQPAVLSDPGVAQGEAAPATAE